MAPGNADLIQPIYEEWGRGNWRPHFDVYHPQMERDGPTSSPGSPASMTTAGIRIRGGVARLVVDELSATRTSPASDRCRACGDAALRLKERSGNWFAYLAGFAGPDSPESALAA